MEGGDKGMSKTVDERIVSMQFDNSKFEKNVKTSITTLEKLKNALKLEDVTNSFKSIDTAAKNVSLDGIAAGVESLQRRFSTLGIVGMTAITNVTNSMMRLAKKSTSFLTDGIINGGKTRAMNLENAHFQLQGLLKDEEKVSAVMKNVNDSVDGTAYSLDSAAKVASQFAASGMRAGDKMFTSLRAVAGVAAMTNSSYDEIGRIFTQVAGNGRLMGDELLQLSSRGMNAAATLASYMTKVGNGAKVTEADVRDMVSKGKVSFELFSSAMDDAFGEHAKKANETFSGAMSNVKASLARIGAEFVSPLVVQNGPLVAFFNVLRERINDIKSNIGPLSVMFVNAISSMAASATKFLKNLNLTEPFKVFYNVIDIIKNVFSGIWSIIKPIGQAFSEIFSSNMTKNLIGMTVVIKDFTSKLKLSSSASENLKNTWTGLFSVLDIIGRTITSVFSGIARLIGVSGFESLNEVLLSITGTLGKGITDFRNYLNEIDVFGITIGKATTFIENIISKIKEFAGAMKNTLINSTGFKNITSTLQGISEAFFKLDFEKGFSILNQGIFASILLGIRNFVAGFKSIEAPFKEFNGVLENVKGILDDVRGCLKAYQDQLKAGTLLTIAGAIGILAGSILVISSIDSESLGRSLTAMTVLFGELIGSLSVFSKISTSMTGVTKSCATMISISIAVSILSGALKKISSIDLSGIGKGLVGIGILMGEISGFLKVTKFDGKIMSTSTGIIVLSSAMLILAEAVKKFAVVSWEGLFKGLTGIGLLLAGIASFVNHTGNTKNMISTGVAMLLFGEAMKMFSISIKSFGVMSWDGLAKGLSAIGGALAEVSIASNLMPKNMISIGLGLISVSIALKALSNSVLQFGSMSWMEIGKGLTIMGGALAELAIGLKLMTGTLTGSTSLLIAAGALSILTAIMKTLANLSWISVAKGLITLAGAFAIIGTAGALLTPLIPSILGLSGAFTLMGLSMIGIGAGLTLIGVGLSSISAGFMSLATVGSVGATSVVSALKVIILGVSDLIPTVATRLAEGATLFIVTLSKSASTIADSLLVMISEVLSSLSKYTPQIVDSIMTFLIGILDSVAKNLPKLIVSAVKVIAAFFQGIIDSLGGLDFTGLTKGLAGVGLLSALMLALSAIASLIPGAMVGVLGMGVVIAELALVLAAVGAFAQIPGLSWLINEGGNFLQTIGTAIGKFFGGIASGFTNALSSSFPKLGSELSAFIINAKPFIEGVKQIDASMLNGVQALTKSIMALTAANVLDSIASWLMGGSSLTRFGEELVPFGQNMRKYANTVVGIDSGVIAASATAANSLVELAKNIPNSGGLISLFAGSNNLNDFGNQLPEFGKSMKDYADSISGIDSDAVEASSSAAKSLVELAENLPKSGGLITLFTGERDFSSFGKQLITFGKAMNDYSKNISGVDASAITASASAGKSLAELANNLPGSMGLLNVITGNKNLALFGAQLPAFGKGMSEYSEAISGIDTKAVESSAIAAKSLSELANNLPSTGGLLSLFTGEKNLLMFGKQLKSFGENMKDYSKSISGIDAKAVEASATAASALSELASNLPKSGGIFKYFTGESDLITFSKQLKPFGNAMKEYSESISGIDDKAVTASATAAKSLSELAKNLPKTGGLAELFTGSNDLSKFSKQLKPFGEGMKEYANAVSGIDDKAVTASANAAKSLSELAANLPKKGGVVNWFTGESDISQFGSQLKSFGSSMKEYSNAVTGIDDKAIIASSTAAKSLAELVENLPASGEISKWFTGENNLTVFGNQLPEFGKKIKEYADAVGTIDGSSVEASTNAAKTLAELANNLPPDQGSIAAWFNGNNNLENFGNQLKGFGGCMKAYAEAVKGIEPASVEASTNAAKVLGELANNLPPSPDSIVGWINGNGNMNSFGNQLPDFGKYIGKYAEAVKQVKPEAVTASANAAKTLSELANNLPPSTDSIFSIFNGKQNLTEFGIHLADFGKSMGRYANSVKDIKPEAVTASANAAKVLGELTANLPPSTDSIFSIFNGKQNLTEFGNQLPDFGNSINKYSLAVEGINAQAITDSAKGAQELVKVIQSFSGISSSLGLFTNAAGLAIMVTQLSPVGAAMKSYSEAVNGIKADSITESTKGAQALVTLINNTAGINVSGIEPFKNAINSLSTIQINDFVKAFDNISTKFTNVGNNMVEAIVNGINGKKSSLTSTAENLVSSFIKSVDNKIPNFKSTGTKCITEFVSGIKSKVKDVNSVFINGVKTVITSIKGYYTEFYNAGSYLVSGFANGISANTYRAAAVAGAMALAAASAARKELDEHSPSKVGYEIGDYFGVAFVNAISDYSRKAYSASSDMANSAKTGLGNAISKIANMINSDIETQPTIRPVVDLSNVSASVTSINGMFNSSRELRATVSKAQSINMMMNTNQNGASNDAVVSAIKGLEKTINKLPTGSPIIVDGVTYDDGSNVASAVKSLVRAAKIERRK